MKEKILIIAAMEDVELDYLKSKLEDKIDTEYKGIRFFEGKLSGKNVILCASDVGIINSAIAVTIAIEKYKPDIIINEGVAGGYTKSVRKGTIVIAEDAINITSMEYKGTGNLINDYEITTFLHNDENKLISQKANKELLQIIKQNFSDYNLCFGRLGSGDIWNKNPERIKYINEKYNAICEDMEGVSIYTASNKYNIPAVCIKGISNNEVLGEKYDYAVSRKIQQFVEEFLKFCLDI